MKLKECRNVSTHKWLPNHQCSVCGEFGKIIVHNNHIKELYYRRSYHNNRDSMGRVSLRQYYYDNYMFVIIRDFNSSDSVYKLQYWGESCTCKYISVNNKEYFGKGLSWDKVEKIAFVIIEKYIKDYIAYWNRYDIIEAYFVYFCNYSTKMNYGRLCKMTKYFEPGLFFKGYDSLTENGKYIYNNLILKKEDIRCLCLYGRPKPAMNSTKSIPTVDGICPRLLLSRVIQIDE